ncbi:MAG TPA: Gfo/Idh/MocA family oxidoreductase, partial [Bacteroidetes bacterium]|nr:Gfo/Idh/MocA family oxidoreductase [Bacteroidota bacterium]
MQYKKIENDRPVRLAILGCGAVAVKHTRTLRRFPGVERYYASRSGERAKSYFEKYKGSGYFTSYNEAINDENINTVLIATPPDSHLALTLQAVQAGKHVIVEKPPFLKSADFDRVDMERKKTGVQVMVAENYFYKPLLKKLREILAAGYIGDIKFIFINATKKQQQEDWRNDPEKAGGGALFEGGIHWINFIANMGFKIKNITGFAPKIPAGRLERSMQVVAEYEEGMVATLLYSWEIDALFKGLRICRIYGTKGSITFEANGVFIFIRGKKW